MNLRSLWPFKAKSIDDVAWRDVGSGAAVDSMSVRATAATSKSLAPTEQYELSIAVNAAVNAICRNLSKCRLRVFTKTGREVISGPLYELLRMPAPKFSQRDLLWEISAWFNISGEFFVNMVPGAGGMPEKLVPVAPPWIQVWNPQKPPNSRAEVIQWMHRWPDGTAEYIRDDHLIFERLFNPNARSIRGLSPLVTGACQVSGAYYAERYNKQFFENGAIPSHIIVLPPGTPKVQRDAFFRQYMATYGNANANAHRVAVVAGGKEFDVKPLEQDFQDGAFMEMMKRGDLKVGQLYRVPAINMGIYDKTRFDTANEERKLFLEETLEPQAELIAEAFQFQLVDPFFRFSDFSTTGGKSYKEFGVGLRKSFEKAEGERGNASKLLLLLDTDTLPIKHEVILAKTESALKMREAYHMSPQEAADFVGMDIASKPERNDVWIENTYVNITHPEQNAALIPGVKPAGTEAAKPADKPKSDPALVKSLQSFLRKIRRPTLDAVDAGSMWTLADADAIGGAELKEPIRRIRHGLRSAVKNQADPAAAAKRYLNDIDTAAMLSGVPATERDEPPVAPSAEVKLMVELLGKLANQPAPVAQVIQPPAAPAIHITMPTPPRTVVETVHRDDKGLISGITKREIESNTV